MAARKSMNCSKMWPVTRGNKQFVENYYLFILSYYEYTNDRWNCFVVYYISLQRTCVVHSLLVVLLLNVK